MVTCKENQTYRVDGVQGVNNKVKDGHESDQHHFVPGTEFTTITWPLVVAETIQWPNDHGSQIHGRRQNIVDDCDLVKGERKIGGQISKSEQDNEDGEDETQGIHSDTPLQFMGLWRRVLSFFQGHEDETGKEAFQHLHDAWQRGEETLILSSGTKVCQDHLAHIPCNTEPGNDRSSCLPVAGAAGEEDGVDDGG